MLSAYTVLDLSSRIGWLTGRLLADLGADVVKVEPPDAQLEDLDWQAYNINKRVLRLDIGTPNGRSDLDRLLKMIDILIDAPTTGESPACLEPARLRALNPRLIHVSVTPYGTTGPRTGWLATDIELMAAGGAMSLAGEPGKTPMRVTVPQSYGWAGAQAAVGALTALMHRTATGEGQHVDVSAQAAVTLALSHAPAFWDMEGSVPTRAGAFMTGRSIKGARYRAFWPCLDGYLNFVLYGGPAGRRTNAELVAWMRDCGAKLGALEGMDWTSFDPRQLTQEEVDRLEQPIAEFFLGLEKREFLAQASRREMLGYPVSTVQDIASDPQLAARGFWHDMPGPDGEPWRHCGSFAIVDGVRAPLRHGLGAEIDAPQLLAELRDRAAAAEPCNEIRDRRRA